MKVRVIKQFKNKYSKKIHKVGDILDISNNRLKEINSAGHGELVTEVIEPEKEEE